MQSRRKACTTGYTGVHGGEPKDLNGFSHLTLSFKPRELDNCTIAFPANVNPTAQFWRALSESFPYPLTYRVQ